jgi:hypothetical protein
MSNFSLVGLAILSTIVCPKYLNGGQSCVLSGAILKPSLARHLFKSLSVLERDEQLKDHPYNENI